NREAALARTEADTGAGLDTGHRPNTEDRPDREERPNTEDRPPRLRAQNVVAGYGNQIVLDGVSVESRTGVTCIFGPNGSGKSTLLQTISGRVPVRSGSVAFGDRRITKEPPHAIVAAGITTLPQTNRVFAGLSVRENLLLGGTTVGDADIVADRIDAVLEVFPELEPALSKKARTLSGGQRVMLGVARAMVTGAEVYLLDEPLSGLAPSMVDTVVDVLERLVERGTQVVLVEQQVREALPLADHVYVLAQGELQFDGPPSDLHDEDELADLYLGLA
ncbi:MAG: ABC transporter ATP-binding protein, partial [Haloarculaceae archaeon]